MECCCKSGGHRTRDCDESLSSEMLIVGSLVLMMMMVVVVGEVGVVTRLERLQHGRGGRCDHPGGERLGGWGR